MNTTILERYIYLEKYHREYLILLPRELPALMVQTDPNSFGPVIMAVYTPTGKVNSEEKYIYEFRGVRTEQYSDTFVTYIRKALAGINISNTGEVPLEAIQIQNMLNDFKKKIIRTQFGEGHWCARADSFENWPMDNCALCRKRDYLK